MIEWLHPLLRQLFQLLKVRFHYRYIPIYGYHIIKVIQKKFGNPFEFDEVELRVKDTLRQQLVRNYVDNLKLQAKIQINNKELESFK